MNRKVFHFFLILILYCSAFSPIAAKPVELLDNEKNTIEVFDKAAPKVIYVHRIKMVVNGASELLHIPSGAGSGILWDNKGHIVTNFHVIAGTDNLAVSFNNHTFSATVVGVEPRHDIAVLKLESPKALSLLKSFQPFEIAPTDELLVGQKTIAIGNPFGLDHSLTTGVISALGRKVPGVGGVNIRQMIQTDASINPGNSGGPLLDSAGRLIGLNTLIYSQSGSSSGVGFAVPANDIARIVTQLIQNGRVKLAGIGIRREQPNVASYLGVKKGILISEVIPRTPAAKAGLKGTFRDKFGRIHVGDIIIALNGQSTNNYDSLYNSLRQIKIGDEIKLTVRRGNRTITHKMKTIDIGSL